MSRNARLKPCPATGMQAQRGVADQDGARTGASASLAMRASGCRCALADAREAAEPLAERRLQLGAKLVDGSAATRVGALRAASRSRPRGRRCSGSTAIGPRCVKRSNARPVERRLGAQLKMIARCS